MEIRWGPVLPRPLCHPEGDQQQLTSGGRGGRGGRGSRYTVRGRRREELEEAAAGPSHIADQPSSESETEDTAPAPAPAPAPVPAAGPSRVPVPEAGPAPRPQSGTKRKRARVPEGNTNIQTAILQALQRQNAVPTPTPLSGIEHFLMGLVPSLERMPPEVLEYVQFQIRKVIFDNTNFTLNLEPV
ncbi:uncharacterized protein LOC115530030 isoform X1 [Gadus morhua]|uniref:uncharacterized protein LOC115530030 isoform X1 n=1 Tax=Gadus morhua TaxID=8049 RepID=UPI0011B472BB|nr:uncharacterized protein LOC115530030 isoform X1 [Gadus morhua]